MNFHIMESFFHLVQTSELRHIRKVKSARRIRERVKLLAMLWKKIKATPSMKVTSRTVG